MLPQERRGGFPNSHSVGYDIFVAFFGGEVDCFPGWENEGEAHAARGGEECDKYCQQIED